MRKLNRVFRPRLSRGFVVVVAVVLMAAASAGTVLADPGGVFGGSDNPWPYNTSDGNGPRSAPVLAAVGDIACEPDNNENAGNPTAVKCNGAGIGGFSAEYATAQLKPLHAPDLYTTPTIFV